MKNIALALSGGGFRAAAFSLGTLSYLNSIEFEDKPLLENVKFIGSTSGGSIANLYYSAALCQEKSFSEIYESFLHLLEGDQLIANVFKILDDDKVWKTRPDKARNLINAFSIAYDAPEILNAQNFGLLNTKLSNTHLEQVTVNATEFANGLSFRFQSQDRTQGASRGRIGNNYIYFKANGMDNADKLKLADLLACSSCFPGGFEPFIFPEDFTHASLSAAALSEGINFTENPFTIDRKNEDPLDDKAFRENPKRFGLMDGGVADNQAIDSVMKANDRKKESDKFDLIIATDVSSYFMDGYTLPLEKKSWWQIFNIKGILTVMLIGGICFPILLLLSICYKFDPWFSLFLIPTGVLLVAYLYVNIKVARAGSNAKRDKSTWGIELFKFGKYFAKLRLTAVKQLLSSRLKSVLLLTNDIYLKQIRRHYYAMLYKDPKLSKIIISNAIYDLSKAKQKARLDVQFDNVIGPNSLTEKDLGISPPSARVIETAEQARLMPTTLWFDPNHEQQNSQAVIIATGQFTTCYNLLKQLNKTESRLMKELKEAELTIPAQVLDVNSQALRTKLEADWTAFNTQSPYWLYNQLGKNIPGFKPL